MKHPFEYQQADSVILFNTDDEDLVPIEFKLPDAPPLDEVHGYGIDPLEQVWRRFEVPIKLKELNEDNTMSPSQKVAHLESNQTYYKAEIEYIQKDIQRAKQGLWYFIKGKPYFIPPAGYFYLQWWPIEGKPVDFRMRDLKFWLFDYMVDNDADVIGFNYPKHRREGATNRASCKRYKVAIDTSFAHCGMQSKDRLHAQEIHEQMVLPAWREYMPFWWKPIYNGNNIDMSVLRFTSPVARNNPDHGKKALNSLIDFRDSGEKAYDGLKLRHLFNDEIGKTVEVNVKKRWEIQRQCLSDGSTIIGKCLNASTVDEMEKGGGRVFKEICDQSHFHQKDETTGRTTSWLYNLFMPAYEGFGGEMPKHLQKRFGHDRWVDKYGFDVTDPETGRPAAEVFHMAVRMDYKRRGDVEGEIEYTRQFPLRWRDCWRVSVKECNFNLAIIEDRLDYYRNGNTDKQRGDFMWENGQQDTRVIWVPNEQGKFYLSWQFEDPRDTNRFFMEDGVRVPGNTRRFVAGGDPFKFKTTKTGKKSDGGGAVFMKHDIMIDPPQKDVSAFTTNRFVCTYSNRPRDKRIYGEDMLMMCVYFGCEMNPEINVEFLWDYFSDRGYGRYLYYHFDVNKNKLSVTPGMSTHEKVKETIFREWQFYIQHHGLRERHDEILEQCKEIEDDMNDYDLFVAGGYALMAANSNPFKPQEQTVVDIEHLFPTYYYN